MSNEEFSLALNFRYGIPIHGETSLCQGCGQMVDRFGIHDTTCRTDGRNTVRHNAGRDTLAFLFRKAAYSVTIETPHLLDRGNDKPADVNVKQWQGNMDLCLDVSIVSGLSDNPNHIQAMETIKNNKYKDACQRNGLLFRPFVMNTLGVFSEECERIMKRIGTGIARRFRLPRWLAINQTRQKIQVATQRAMVAAIPPSFDWERGSGLRGLF